MLAPSHQTLHNDQLASGRFGPRCEGAGGAFPSQGGSDFIFHWGSAEMKGIQVPSEKRAGFWGVSRLPPLLFLEASLWLPPPSIYIPGTDSEAIEIGFGIAECGRTADGSLPETARQLGARAPGRVRPGPQTHVSRQSTRGLKCFAPFFRRFCGLGLSHPEYGLRSAVTGLGAAARPGRFRLAYLLGFFFFFFSQPSHHFLFFY